MAQGESLCLLSFFKVRGHVRLWHKGRVSVYFLFKVRGHVTGCGTRGEFLFTFFF